MSYHAYKLFSPYFFIYSGSFFLRDILTNTLSFEYFWIYLRLNTFQYQQTKNCYQNEASNLGNLRTVEFLDIKNLI